MNVETLAPRKAAKSQAARSKSGHPIAPPVEAGAVPASADVSASLKRALSLTYEDGSL